MSQLAALTEHLRRIQLDYLEATRALGMAANTPQAAPEVIAHRMELVESALEGIRAQALRAKAIAHDAAERSRAVTVCHTRGHTITECAPVTSPSGR